MIKILGVKRLDYESKKTGRRVQGVNIFFTDNTPQDGLDGIFCGSTYVPSNVYNSILDTIKKATLMGLEIREFSYNRWGSVCGVII